MSKAVEIKNRSVSFYAAAPANGTCKSATLFYLLEGRVAFAYDNRRAELGASDILVINRGTDYTCSGSEGVLLASLDLTEDTFESACDGIRVFVNCDSSRVDNGHYAQLRSLLRQMILSQLYVQEDKQKYSHLAFAYYSSYYKLLETIVSCFLEGCVPMPGQSPAPDRNPRRREMIERYLNIHYMEPVSLDDIANELFLSKNTLSKYFSQTFGVPFSQYLKDLRLKHAMSDLLYTGHPITQVVFDNGFSGSSFFNKAFREKFGKNPRDVRREFQEGRQAAKGAGKEDIHQRVKELLDRNSGPLAAPPQKARTDFSVQDCQPIGPCWRSLINIGSASEVLRTDIQSHIRILSQYFTYARFWDPFSAEMLLDINGKRGSYNFLRLDQVLDSLLAAGMKPFVVFEPKLERVNEGVGEAIIRSKHEMLIDSMDAWRNMVTSFVRHIVEKYGVEEVEKWQFELTYGVYQLRGLEPLESYLSLFRVLAEAVRQYAPHLLVGGPTLPSNELELTGRIFTGLQERGCAPGFVSFISFAYEADRQARTYALRSIDEDYLLKDVQLFRQTMEENGFGSCPLYVTEWNETVADRNFLNDSCYRGAYIVKNLLDVYPYVSAVGYFSGTDLRAEYFDSGTLLQGGNGLISRDGICKPAGFAMRLLHMLGEYRISGGPQFLVTTDRRDNYTIIAHNKRKLSLYSYQTPEWKIEKEKLERFCEDGESVRLSLSLTDVKNGKYRVREHRVNAHYGSILDLWKELDFRETLSRKDIQYLQRICEPHLHFRTAEVTSHTLPLEAVLEPNEILLIEVKRDI